MQSVEVARLVTKTRGRAYAPSRAALTTDAELLAGGRTADFRVFYERHVAAVLTYVARHTRQPDFALDVVAETFARALEHRDQYDARRGPAVAWLIGIARNEINGALRRGRVAEAHRERLGMEPIELDDEGMALIARHMRIDLMAALAGLPREQREAIARHFLADEPYSDIATQAGCSEQVVRKRVSRGLAVLRRALGEDP